MASRAAKRMAAAEQEAATTERRTQTPASRQEDLPTEGSRWGTEGPRSNRQKWQRGGKALAPGCDHQSWRTYQQASRWWIRCEDCEGRIDSGKVATQEDGTMMLLGWKPPTWPEPEAEDTEMPVAKDVWSCGMCKTKLTHGTKGVTTEVGKVCMICRTGPGKMKKKADDGHEQEFEDGSRKTPSKATPTTETSKSNTVKGEVLDDKQIEFLEKNLTAKQWRELALKGRVVTAEQMNMLEDMLSAKMWRQLWA